MAWPVTRSDGFDVDEDVWNELIAALSIWGGDVNAGGYNITELNAVYATWYMPRSGNILYLNADAGDRAIALPNHIHINGTPSGLANIKRLWFLTSGLSRMLVSVQGEETGANAGSNFYIHSCSDAGAVLRGADLCVIRATGYVGISNESPGLPLSFPPSLGEKIALYDNTAGNDVYGLGMAGGTLRLFSGQVGAVKIARRTNPGVFVDEIVLDPANRGLIFPLANGQTFADSSLQNGSGYFYWHAGLTQVKFRIRDTAGVVRESFIQF